jgi:hypothetical protein
LAYKTPEKQWFGGISLFLGLRMSQPEPSAVRMADNERTTTIFPLTAQGISHVNDSDLLLKMRCPEC